MERKIRIKEIRKKINGKQLLWFGTRGSDALSFNDFPELKLAASLICPYNIDNKVKQYCLEEHTALRVDLNQYNIDTDTSNELTKLYDYTLSAVSKPSIIVAYRPSQLLSSLYFPRHGITEYWGMFHLKQFSYEFKPWVEAELQKNGIRIIPWKYYSNGDVQNFLNEMGNDPVVLRLSRSSGGAGIIIAETAREVTDFCYYNKDGFFSASKYMDNSLPISINAVVFSDSSVKIFPPSVQLLGIRECTNRSFGFCGNDFGKIQGLPDNLLIKIEKMVIDIGKWLSKTGYLGVFGIDAVVYKNTVYMAEVNPRFLASSPMIALTSKKNELTDVYLEHMAAYCGVEPLPYKPLIEQVKELPKIAQLICYNKAENPIFRIAERLIYPENMNIYDLPDKNIAVAPEGQLFKVIFNENITKNGFELLPNIRKKVEDLVYQWVTGNIELHG